MMKAKVLSENIRKAVVDDISRLDDFAAQNGIEKITAYYDLQFEAQEAGTREVWLYDVGGEICAYCVLNWQPKYGYFKAMGWPEIQDLNTAKAHRQKGYATALIEHCEARATAKGLSYMGMGVGVHASYGPPQRLYAKLGYVPDGYGVTYDRKQVGFGEFRPVDDDLCLMMMKRLKPA